MSPSAVLSEKNLKELRNAVRGAVIAPGDGGYDEARSTFNATIDRRPLAVARPIDAADVSAAVSFAAAEGLPVSVRGGGHSVAGHCVGDGALMIDLVNLKQVTVDPAARRVTAGGGCAWEDLDPVCVRHGLATTGGTFADTGVGGLTLGGGIGHLQGRCGLSVDNLLAAEVVTADGRTLRAGEGENEDLFWALRGGGGNFGVVTSFEFRLHPVGTMLGGLIAYAHEHAGAAVRLFRDLVADAPDELVCMLVLTGAPDGTKIVIVSVAFNGPVADGEAAIRPLRESLPVLTDTVTPLDYLGVQAIFPKVPFGLRHYWKGHFTRSLPDDAIDATVEHSRAYPGVLGGGILLEPFYGAPSRVPNDAMAFNQRDARFNVSALGVWEAAEADEAGIRWAREYAEKTAPLSTTGAGYVNYSTETAAPDRVASFWGPQKFQRLRAIKRAYDPANLFRFNQNIPPADSAVLPAKKAPHRR